MSRLVVVDSIESRAEINAAMEPPPADICALASDANEGDRQQAAQRLERRLPAHLIGAVAKPFPDAAVVTGAELGFDARSWFTSWLSAEPRVVVEVGRGVPNAQAEIRDMHGPVAANRVGWPLEPESDTFQLDPYRVWELINSGASFGVRHVDRSMPLAAKRFVDDLLTVGGFDVFAKLFVSAGTQTLTGWHHDKSDVLVTMLWGEKRFAVKRPDATESDDFALDVVLRPGTFLLLPSHWPHCVTPADGDSGLLSFGLMRWSDWQHRDVVPSHLGIIDYAPSDSAYRRLLRPRTPSLVPNVTHDARTRIPGGVEVVGRGRDRLLVVLCQGQYLLADDPALTSLLELHRQSPACGHIDHDMINEFARAGLLRDGETDEY